MRGALPRPHRTPELDGCRGSGRRLARLTPADVKQGLIRTEQVKGRRKSGSRHRSEGQVPCPRPAAGLLARWGWVKLMHELGAWLAACAWGGRVPDNLGPGRAQSGSPGGEAPGPYDSECGLAALRGGRTRTKSIASPPHSRLLSPANGRSEGAGELLPEIDGSALAIAVALEPKSARMRAFASPDRAERRPSPSHESKGEDGFAPSASLESCAIMPQSCPPPPHHVHQCLRTA
jgi:hypothetical protein